MPVGGALAELQANAQQCESLISNIHGQDAVGNFLMPEIDRKQVTVAAFLNLFIAWEGFLESVTAHLLVGVPTIGGVLPNKYASPATAANAKAMIVGANKYFDYGNQEFFKKMVRLYFDGGYPFEPHISAITTDLSDVRTIRNASAHTTSTTQAALEALANRILGAPHPGIEVYGLITAVDPGHPAGATIFTSYKERLLIAAQAIAQG